MQGGQRQIIYIYIPSIDLCRVPETPSVYENDLNDRVVCSSISVKDFLRYCHVLEVSVSVKEYVNFVSIPEYGLVCQSRQSKSCVVNNGTLSTEVLRVVIEYRSTRSKLFRLFGFGSKR
jgi:hypothetical protein